MKKEIEEEIPQVPMEVKSVEFDKDGNPIIITKLVSEQVEFPELDEETVLEAYQATLMASVKYRIHQESQKLAKVKRFGKPTSEGVPFESEGGIIFLYSKKVEEHCKEAIELLKEKKWDKLTVAMWDQIILGLFWVKKFTFKPYAFEHLVQVCMSYRDDQMSKLWNK